MTQPRAQLSASPGMSSQQLVEEISRRRPWYQRIEFPDHQVTTTDDRANAMLDAPWDNKIGDLTLEEAAIMRPQPKWAEIRRLMPDVSGLEVLEIGANCGFFSIEFARAGAKRVIGLDVSDKWLNNARWAAETLGLTQIEFQNIDFMNYSGGEEVDPPGLLSDYSEYIPLPQGKFDVVFMSTVIDHLFFPLFSIYKMLRISRKYVIIDSPVMHFDLLADKKALALDVAADRSHHGFIADPRFWRVYTTRLGVPDEDIQQHVYNEGRNMCMIIDCSRRRDSLWGA